MLVPVDNIVEVKCSQTGNEWIPVSIWTHPTVREMDDLGESIHFDDFNSLYEACSKGDMRNMTATKTIFGKLMIRIRNASCLTAKDIKLTERNFKGLVYRVRNEVHEEWSMESLYKDLSASDFVLLAKERNWFN